MKIFLSNGQVLTVRFYPVGERGFYPKRERPWRLQTRTAPGARLDFTVDAWELQPLEIKEPGTGTAGRDGRSARTRPSSARP